MVWSDEIDELDELDEFGEVEFVEDVQLTFPPAPSIAGTVCLLFGIVLAYSLYPAEETPSTMARVPAIQWALPF
jgi:hypothetical protein